MDVKNVPGPMVIELPIADQADNVDGLSIFIMSFGKIDLGYCIKPKPMLTPRTDR